MKKMKYLLCLVSILFLGCAPKIEYVPKLEIKEVKVPVMMNVKRIECDFYGETYDDIVDKMLICLKKYKVYNEHLIDASKKQNWSISNGDEE